MHVPRAILIAAAVWSLHAQAASAVEDPAATPPSRDALVAIVRGEAATHGLPPEVAEAVAEIESGYQPATVGGVGEIGLMQIRPATAEMLGHQGGALGLFDPQINARYAVRYLADAWRLANGDLCRALMKYRAGHNSERMSALSVEYCRRAKVYLARLGSPLADAVLPKAEFGTDVLSASIAPLSPTLWRRRGRVWTEADDARYWNAHEARIKALTAKAERRRNALIKRYAAKFARR